MSQLQNVYYGRVISEGDLRKLNGQGQALVGANNQELACQSATVYFDTQDEWRAYNDAFEQREQALVEQKAKAGSLGQPCLPYEDAPRVVTADAE